MQERDGEMRKTKRHEKRKQQREKDDGGNGRASSALSLGERSEIETGAVFVSYGPTSTSRHLSHYFPITSQPLAQTSQAEGFS